MKHAWLVFFLVLAGCRTAPLVPERGATPRDAFAAAQAWCAQYPGAVVERYHADGEGYVALVARDGTWELLRLAKRDGIWHVIETLPGQQDYLWPEQ